MKTRSPDAPRAARPAAHRSAFSAVPRAAALAAVVLVAPATALAHAGHATAGASHWHATDTFGLLLVAGAAALAYWVSRSGK